MRVMLSLMLVNTLTVALASPKLPSSAVDREIVVLLEQAGATHGESLISFRYLMEMYDTPMEIRVEDALGDDTSMGNFTRSTLLGLGRAD